MGISKLIWFVLVADNIIDPSPTDILSWAEAASNYFQLSDLDLVKTPEEELK